MQTNVKGCTSAYGSANNMTGDNAGVWGAYVNNSNNTGLTTAQWYACSYGFAI